MEGTEKTKIESSEKDDEDEETKKEETKKEETKKEGEMPEWAKKLQQKVDQLSEQITSQTPKQEKDPVVLIPEPVPPTREQEEEITEILNPEPKKTKSFWEWLK